jgi:hypothetical protein
LEPIPLAHRSRSLKTVHKVETMKADQTQILFRLPKQVLSVIVLTGVLSLGAWSLTAAAAPTSPVSTIAQPKDRPDRSDRLPPRLANIVRRDLARRQNLPVGQVRVTESSRASWGNGCLELPAPDEFCTEAIVEGWRIQLNANQQTWVYHTDATGSVIRLEGANAPGEPTGLTPITPVQIPTSSLPASLEGGVLFRAISSGGFVGGSYTTTLYEDGRVIQQRPGSNQTRSYTVSRQQVQQFRQLLEQQRFEQFNRLSYPAPRGAADYFTVTLISRSSTAQYADMVQDQVPSALQQVIQTWNAIASRS